VSRQDDDHNEVPPAVIPDFFLLTSRRTFNLKTAVEGGFSRFPIKKQLVISMNPNCSEDASKSRKPLQHNDFRLPGHFNYGF
jgi:hypothetical protein